MWYVCALSFTDYARCRHYLSLLRLRRGCKQTEAKEGGSEYSRVDGRTWKFILLWIFQSKDSWRDPGSTHCVSILRGFKNLSLAAFPSSSLRMCWAVKWIAFISQPSVVKPQLRVGGPEIKFTTCWTVDKASLTTGRNRLSAELWLGGDNRFGRLNAGLGSLAFELRCNSGTPS